MHLVDGVVTGLTWPAVELQAATRRRRAATCCCSSAPNPTMPGGRSRARSSTSRSTCRCGSSSASAPTPRRCRTPARLASPSPPATHRWPRTTSCAATVDVPAGVQAAIERRAHELGLAAVGLWAQVPHYLAAMPYPAASVALLDGLGDRRGAPSRQRHATHARPTPTRERVDALVNENDEHKQMVRQLEVTVDAEQESTEHRTRCRTTPLRRRARGRARALPPRPGRPDGSVPRCSRNCPDRPGAGRTRIVLRALHPAAASG